MIKSNNTSAAVLMAAAVVLFGCEEQAAAPAFQTTTVAAEESAARTGPRIEFEKTFHDFGVIDDSEPVHYEFAFRNAGDEMLVISNIKSSGSGSYTFDPIIVPPNTSSSITINFKPKGRSGKQAKSYLVESNDQTNRIVNLRIAADIFTPISLEPRVFRFDQIEAGHSKTIIATVRIRGEGFAITGVAVDGDYASATIVSEEPLLLTETPGTYYTLEVTIHDNAPLGWHDHRVIIRTDHPDKPLIEAPLWANVLGPIEVQPAKLPLGVVRAGTEFQREIRLVSRTGTPFRMTGYRIDTAAEGLGMKVEPAGDDPDAAQPMIRFTVTGTGPATIGKLEGNIVIQTDADTRPIHVPFHCVVRPRNQALAP